MRSMLAFACWWTFCATKAAPPAPPSVDTNGLQRLLHAYEGCAEWCGKHTCNQVQCRNCDTSQCAKTLSPPAVWVLPPPPPAPDCAEWCNKYTCSHPDCKHCHFKCELRCESWCPKKTAQLALESPCSIDGCQNCKGCPSH
mmetsp:Transcript_19587/g.32667  ORF Transcript_19587/g.32667 Transcript_19587/m.32667 type:complete len:141 (-) Transcript_19587:251-673(-)